MRNMFSKLLKTQYGLHINSMKKSCKGICTVCAARLKTARRISITGSVFCWMWIPIKENWSKFFKEFSPQTGYIQTDDTDYEIYFENGESGLFCELWVPVKKNGVG